MGVMSGPPGRSSWPCLLYLWPRLWVLSLPNLLTKQFPLSRPHLSTRMDRCPLNFSALAEIQSGVHTPASPKTLFPESQGSKSSPAPPPAPNTPAHSSFGLLHLQPAPRSPCSAQGFPEAALDPELVQQRHSHLRRSLKC